VGLPLRRERGEGREITWEEAIAEVVSRLARYRPDEIGLLASPRMSNEDLFALEALAGRLGVTRLAFSVPPATPGDEDKLLIRSDKNPNRLGAELIGLGGDADALLADARAGRLRCLWVFHHDLLESAWPAAETRAGLQRLDTLIWSGTNAGGTTDLAHLVLPSAAWVEREGTFTNFEGRVQRFRTAVEPFGQARADWDVLGQVLATVTGEGAPARAEQWFRRLAEAVPPFAGLTYRSIGDAGQRVAAR
jgi:predicted molibdopterin-dependent oxidoreductase YjgC